MKEEIRNTLKSVFKIMNELFNKEKLAKYLLKET